MVQIGVIGYGYWGPNIVRNFSAIDGAKVVMVCDQRAEALGSLKKAFPDIETTTSQEIILKSPRINIIAIVTPVSTHFELAKKALINGKHVFVEKPFTDSSVQAKELIDLAEQKELKIMVDHTFLFTGAVRKIKETIDNGVLGNIFYYDSTRVNLGLFQHDVNVVWDLAPHDFSIMDYLLKESPEALTANGIAHVNKMEDMAYITIYFPNKLIAHFNVNWLSPVKVRSTLIGGKHKMLLWNDVNVDEKIKIYDKGVNVENRESVYKLLVSYRSGDMYAPRIDNTEALKLECQYFIDCINSGETPINDGKAGFRVVKLLEACKESLKHRGKLINLTEKPESVLI
ncbi:MAG TPA: Gfo/Idh/MocA family oxidoreductase [Chitinispirillaceae bacterium]|nr:Gfo/Idh/MocA family oxidoreductase [Chitinispirillaceae bacterium]